RKHYAKGLCHSCYVISRRDMPPEVKGAQAEVKAAQYAKAHKQLITVNLQMRHSVNGQFFGPGPVRVSQGLADAFLNTEYEAAQKELSLVQQQAFMIQYGPNGSPVKRQVPWERFNEILNAGG
ncbi:MAG: hypothetical protein ACREIQ_08705, partial [Nitrospiria bacterium]